MAPAPANTRQQRQRCHISAAGTNTAIAKQLETCSTLLAVHEFSHNTQNRNWHAFPHRVTHCCCCCSNAIVIHSLVADGAVHGIVCGDEQPRVDKLQQQESPCNVQPGRLLRPRGQPDLEAAVVEQRCPGCDDAAGDCDALHVITRRPVVVGSTG